MHKSDVWRHQRIYWRVGSDLRICLVKAVQLNGQCTTICCPVPSCLARSGTRLSRKYGSVRVIEPIWYCGQTAHFQQCELLNWNERLTGSSQRISKKPLKLLTRFSRSAIGFGTVGKILLILLLPLVAGLVLTGW